MTCALKEASGLNILISILDKHAMYMFSLIMYTVAKYSIKGPLDNTQLAFWAMIIQEKTEAVIMLCNTIECVCFAVMLHEK